MAEWPRPENRKQLQRFLGFAYFYKRFIRDFSRVVSPLTRLISTLHMFSRVSEAETAFCKLKQLFSSAPVLCHPDPHIMFTVVLDASDSGVGDFLSQSSPKDNCFHPCAYFSYCLSPSEVKYKAGNRELLAMKLALKEWRHWLEGADISLIIWTDHKNLACLQQAKILNARQAKWSLFFSRFSFSIIYRPGSKNVKPEALPQQFSSSDHSKHTKTILPPSCTTGSITCGINTGPPNRQFVPKAVLSKFLSWIQSPSSPTIWGSTGC